MWQLSQAWRVGRCVGGITVFAPLFDEAVSPTARVAVIGVGGLGHIALQFCRAWGCAMVSVTWYRWACRLAAATS